MIEFYLREINIVSIAFRVALSLIIGGVLGMERGLKNRPAGLRTYMLVCLGSTLVMMTNQYVFQQFPMADPTRMGAQVVSGIGFLGAGTIILTGKNQVMGITTAAGLWAAGCLGLAIGTGFYEGAIVCGATIYIVLDLMYRLDGSIRSRSKLMVFYLEMFDNSSFSEFIVYARELEVEISNVQLSENKLAEKVGVCIVFTACSRVKRSHSEITEILSRAPGVYFLEAV